MITRTAQFDPPSKTLPHTMMVQARGFKKLLIRPLLYARIVGCATVLENRMSLLGHKSVMFGRCQPLHAVIGYSLTGFRHCIVTFEKTCGVVLGRDHRACDP